MTAHTRCSGAKKLNGGGRLDKCVFVHGGRLEVSLSLQRTLTPSLAARGCERKRDTERRRGKKGDRKLVRNFGKHLRDKVRACGALWIQNTARFLFCWLCLPCSAGLAFLRQLLVAEPEKRTRLLSSKFELPNLPPQTAKVRMHPRAGLLGQPMGSLPD